MGRISGFLTAMMQASMPVASFICSALVCVFPYPAYSRFLWEHDADLQPGALFQEEARCFKLIWREAMCLKREHKNFWDRNAGLYDCFMRKDRAVYEKMYELIRPVVKDKTVLEVATGTGLIAKHIVKAAAHIEATDASPEMITEAKRGNYSAKLRFSVQDMFSLPYASKSFDVVIVSKRTAHCASARKNHCERSKRVLKDDGVLIAPTFTHAEKLISRQGQSLFS